ncbi:MAG: NAD-dependent dihydropyrimidine dehydrogenase subunit PreA, partial [Clostridia bacterium]|nr:NAD-dependent dihydropyrimidine dehydrogenase subunit PreA [Clostridia bacterium]
MLFERTILREDLIRCALCEDAPCTAACGQLPVAKILRSVWFDDEKVAAARLPERLPCVSCSAHCESACVRPREVPIWKLMMRLHGRVKPELEV